MADYLDYLAQSNPYLRPFRMPRMPGEGRPEPTFPPLPPAEEKGMLSKVTNTALGGLGYLGEVLNKPGRAVRGLLGGQPSELLNLVPFSDTVGLTDPEKQVTGRDLLEKMGVLSQNESGLDWGDVAGFGADVLTDPLSYLTFGSGALTGAGLAAKKAGTLAKTATARIGAGHQGLVGIGGLGKLLGAEGVAFGTGQTGLNILDAVKGAAGAVGKPAGWLAGKIPGAEAVGRLGKGSYYGLRGLFGDYGGATHPLAQEVYADVVRPGLEEATRNVRLRHAETLSEAAAKGFGDRPTQDLIRNFLEGVPVSSSTPGEQAAIDFAKGAKQRLADELTESQSLGVARKELENYAPRLPEMTNPKVARAYKGRAFDPFDPSQIAREEFFKGPYRQTETSLLEEMLHNPEITGAGRTLADPVAKIRVEELLGFGQPQYQRLKDIRKFNPPARLKMPGAKGGNVSYPNPLYQEMEHLAGAHGQAEQLAAWLKTKELLGQGENFFGSPLENLARHELGTARSDVMARGIHELVSRAIEPLSSGADLVPLNASTFAGLGLAHTTVLPTGEVPTALLKIAQRTGKSVQDLAQMGIPRDVYGAASRFLQPLSAPEAARPLLEFFDGLQNTFKRWVTLPWAPKHVRDLTTGAWQNWVGGASDPLAGGVGGYLKPYADAMKIADGGVADGLAQAPVFQRLGITDDALATQKLAQHLYASGTGGPGGLVARDTDMAGVAAAGLQDLGMIPPGTPGWIPKPSMNPLEYAKNPAAYGETLARRVDFLNRASATIGYLKQGYDFDAATAAAKALHYDYNMLTPFESGVMRRLIPFYSWSRKNAEFVIGELLTNPAKEAAGIRLGSQLRDKDTFVPGFIGEGMGIPLPGAEQGFQKYLSNLGLPIEDEVIKSLGSALHGEGGRALGPLLGQLTPPLKYGIEAATGTQLFSGRRFEDMKPTTAGKLGGLLNEDFAGPLGQLISNTPFSRVSSTIDKLLNTEATGGKTPIPEAAINLLTGARVTDVNQQNEEIAALNALRDQLQGHPGVHVQRRPYVRKEDAASLSPEDVLLMRLQSGIEKKRAARAKEQKAQIGVGR